MTYAATLSARAHRPQAAQCVANIFPAIRFASAFGLFKIETPSGNSIARRIGPTSFFSHHEAECLARALVKYALHKSCNVTTGTVQPENENFSIPSPRFNPRLNHARNVKRRHHGHSYTVKNPLLKWNEVIRSAA